MATLISAISETRAFEPRRVDDAPASKQRDVRVDPRRQAPEVRSADRPQPDPEDVERAAARLNEALESFNKDLAISISGEPGRLTVRVTDPRTGDVIRQFPPEQLLEAEVTIDKIIGLFVNDEV
jgi:flagellar protein FlaG